MQEGLISIPCKFEGKPGNYLAKIWQDRDWGVERGPTLGYNTELTEVHPKVYHSNIHFLNCHF